MYENIGNKIKGLAIGIFVVETIASIFTALFLLSINEPNLIGLIVLVFGPLIAWVSSWVLYAFGELVEDVGIIRHQNQKDNNATPELNNIFHPQKANNTFHTENKNETFCEICGADITFDKFMCHVCKNKINTDTATFKTATIIKNKKDEMNDICGKCGADISSDTSVCHVCGKELKNSN